MSTPHLPPDVPLPPSPRGVMALDTTLGEVVGQRLVLLSVEMWDGWTDVRFARFDVGATRRLTRRVPPAAAWSIKVNGRPVRVLDAVGRGDRTFSNGEVRLAAPLAPGDTLDLAVHLVPDLPPLTATLTLPTGAQPTGAQPTGARPTGARPTGTGPTGS